MGVSPSAESPVEIVLALEEQTVSQHQACFFTCDVNKEDVDVTWHKNDEIITPSDKHVVKHDGKRHSLVILDADQSDIADYTVTVGDRKSSAKLSLDGMLTCTVGLVVDGNNMGQAWFSSLSVKISM